MHITPRVASHHGASPTPPSLARAHVAAWLALLVCAPALTACPAKPPPPPPPPPAVVDAGMVTDLTAVGPKEASCTADTDCTLITEDCCGCTGGGRQVGVRADALEAIGARRAPVCAAVSCAQVMSEDPSCTAARARCHQGRCIPDVKGGAPAATQGIGVQPIDATGGSETPKK